MKLETKIKIEHYMLLTVTIITFGIPVLFILFNLIYLLWRI
jgi:hypothetical protein